jgi:hypothetical protein
VSSRSSQPVEIEPAEFRKDSNRVGAGPEIDRHPGLTGAFDTRTLAARRSEGREMTRDFVGGDTGPRAIS